MVKTNYEVPIHSVTKLKNHKVQNWVNRNTYLNNILDSQQVSQNIWNTVSFHLLKFDSFKNSGLKVLNLCFKHFKCSNV